MAARRFFANLGLIAASVALALVACEIGLAVFLRDASPEPVTRDNYAFYQFDPVLGWSNSPRARGTYQT